MTTSKRVFVLVGDDQVPLSPGDVATAVTSGSFAAATDRFGYSETALRAFLADNGFVARKSVTYERTPQVPSVPDEVPAVF